MRESKLISLLNTFSPDEMKSFEKFVASSYFNSVKIHSKLLMELKKFYPEFKDDKLTNENIFKKLYKAKPFNKQIMWNLASGLERLAEEFIIHQRLKFDEFTRYSLLLLGLGDKPSKYYYKKLKEFEKYSDSLNIGEDDQTGTDFFKVKWKYEAIRGVYYQMIDKLSLLESMPINKGEYLILSFLQNLTQDIYNIYTLGKMYNLVPKLNLPLKFLENINFPEIIRYSKDNNFDKTWIIEFYFNKIMCVLKPEDEQYFFNLRSTFEAKHANFTNFENRNTISSLTNYCAEKIRHGSEQYLKILFEINKFRLKENLYLNSGIMRKSLYIQMVTTALAVNEMNWTKQFIEENTGKLNHEHQLTMGSIAKALLFFKLKKYDDAIESLNRVEFIDVSDKLQAKTLIAKTYFEMGSYESLLNHIDSAKHFLGKNKSVSNENKKNYGNFFNFLSRLIAFTENYDQYSFSVLDNDLNKTNELCDKKWLLEKLKELENYVQN